MLPPPTPRLRFRQMLETDHADLDRMFSDPYARSIYPRMADPDQVAKWIEWTRRNYEEFGFGLWVIETFDGVFVGDCGLTYQLVLDEQVLEIGYHVTLAQRGHGFALEAARAVLAFGFAETVAERIYSIVSPANPASQRVAGQLHQQRGEFRKPDGLQLLFFFTDRQ